MDVAEANAILTSELSKLRAKPFSELVALIREPQTLEITAPSGAWYQVEVSATWDDPRKPNDVLRVFGCIDDGGISAYSPLSDDFLVTPQGRFIGE